ncbi:MAG TPA: glycosyltransferase family 39 protein [Elusimicrobiota bacterium]|nr:glycosyltransferase family 39 protein [Elusimicrobiota bacterium]
MHPSLPQTPPPATKPWTSHLLPLLVPLLAFSLFGWWRIDLPGLHGEEIGPMGPLLGWMVHGPFRFLFAGYHGPVEGLCSMPFVFVLGSSVGAVRLMPLLAAHGTIAALYGLAFRLSRNRGTAFAAALLFALAPTFVAGTRVGLQSGAILLFFTLGAFFFGHAWLTSGRWRDLLLTAGFLALGAGCRVWAVFFDASLFLALLLTLPRSLFFFRKNARPLAAAGILFAAVAGTPYLIEYARGADVLAAVTQRQAEHPSGFQKNAAACFRNIHRLIDGTGYFYDMASPPMKDALNRQKIRLAGPAIFWSTLLFVVLKSLFHRPSVPPVLQFLAALIVFHFSGNFLVSHPRTDYLFVLLPFMFLFLAVFWGRSFPARGKRRHLPLLLLSFFFVSRSLSVLRTYTTHLAETGGWAEYSTTLTGLGETVRCLGFRQVFLPEGERPAGNTLRFLSAPHGQVQYIPAAAAVSERFLRAGPTTAFVGVHSWRSRRPGSIASLIEKTAEQQGYEKMSFFSFDDEPLADLFYKPIPARKKPSR